MIDPNIQSEEDLKRGLKRIGVDYRIPYQSSIQDFLTGQYKFMQYFLKKNEKNSLFNFDTEKINQFVEMIIVEPNDLVTSYRMNIILHFVIEKMNQDKYLPSYKYLGVE